VSILPRETNTVLGLFCHWQNTTDGILDLNRIGTVSLSDLDFEMKL